MAGFFGGSSSVNATIPTVAGIMAQTSCYGRPIPIVYGRNKIAPNVIWLGPLTPYDLQSPGKGGSSGDGTGYKAPVQLALCEGPLTTVDHASGVGRAWQGQQLYTQSDIPGFPAPPFDTVQIGTRPQSSWSFLAGTLNQAVTFNGSGPEYRISDALFSGVVSVSSMAYTAGIGWIPTTLTFTAGTPSVGQYTVRGNTLIVATGTSYPGISVVYTQSLVQFAAGYTGTAVACIQSMDLGSSGTVKQFVVEVDGFLMRSVSSAFGPNDVAPPDIIADGTYGLMVNTQFGAGWDQSLIDVEHGNNPLGSTTDSSYRRYCLAQDIWLSPVYDEQQLATDHLQDLLDATNSSCVWSQGVLRFIPLADQPVTGNSVTYTPNSTVVYAIGDSDYIREGTDDPIEFEGVSVADTFNSAQVEFLQRDTLDPHNAYSPNLEEAQDSGNIAKTKTTRRAGVKQLHMITQQKTAQLIAKTIVQRSIYTNGTWRFTLGPRHALVEPLDLLSLSESKMGLQDVPVRVTQIDRQPDRSRQITARSWPFGTANSPAYASQTANTQVGSRFADPGLTDSQFMVPQYQITQDQLELWVGVSGGPNWGGCQVWISFDGGTSYQQFGLITQKAVFGKMTTGPVSFPATAGTSGFHYVYHYPSETMSVDLSASRGSLASVSANDQVNLLNNCLLWTDLNAFSSGFFKGGEFLAFKTAGLSAPFNYTLTDLLRAQLGTIFEGVSNGPGNTGACMLINDAVVRYKLPPGVANSSIFVKLPAFNLFGAQQQQLSDVPAIPFTVGIGTGVSTESFKQIVQAAGTSTSVPAPTTSTPMQFAVLPDLNYTVVATPVSSTGTPASGANTVVSYSKGFDNLTFNVQTAPGTGNTVSFLVTVTPSKAFWAPLPPAPG